MSAKFHTSPAITVTAATPIGECIALMCKHNVGSVLVMDDQNQAKLKGIFTERDLLTKLEDIGRTRDHWNWPIKSVMTSPVLTIDSSDLNQAAELMLKHHVRHLPITVAQEGSKEVSVVGIVSMRDIFSYLVEKEGARVEAANSVRKKIKARGKVSVVTQENGLARFLIKEVEQTLSVEARHVGLLDKMVEPVDVLIVDLDHIPILSCLQFVKARKTPQLKLIVILFSPLFHNDKVVRALEQFGKSSKYSAMKKPISVLQFRETLSSVKI
jgi:CBS domain-containing protein